MSNRQVVDQTDRPKETKFNMRYNRLSNFQHLHSERGYKCASALRWIAFSSMAVLHCPTLVASLKPDILQQQQTFKNTAPPHQWDCHLKGHGIIQINFLIVHYWKDLKVATTQYEKAFCKNLHHSADRHLTSRLLHYLSPVTLLIRK